jgi:predicted porin
MKYELSKRTFTYVSYATAAGGAEASFSSRANFRWNNAAAVSTSNVMVGLSHSF